MAVRLAKYGDEVKMYDAIALGHADNGLWSFSPTKVCDLINRAVSAKKTIKHPVIGIIENDEGLIVAMTCFQLESYWYTDEWHISELFNWVHPQHRKSTYVHELMEFQKKFTDDMTKLTGKKIALVTGVMSTKRLEEKMHLFGRKYPQVGAIYAYNLDLPNDMIRQRHLDIPIQETIQ